MDFVSDSYVSQSESESVSSSIPQNLKSFVMSVSSMPHELNQQKKDIIPAQDYAAGFHS